VWYNAFVRGNLCSVVYVYYVLLCVLVCKVVCVACGALSYDAVCTSSGVYDWLFLVA